MGKDLLKIKQKPPAGSIYIWNALGSLLNAAASVLLLMTVNQILGETSGGVFSIGFATSQIVYSVISYGMATYQVTDDKLHFGAFLSAKLVLLCLSAVYCAVIIFQGGYSSEKALITIMLALAKAADGFSDLKMAVLQKNGRLDINGKLFSARVTASFALFVITLLLTKHLLTACAVYSAVNVLWVLTVDVRITLVYQKIYAERSARIWLRVLLDCLPLFLGNFLIVFITNDAKYTLDSCFGENIQNVYSILIMPASVINLFAIFIVRPMIVDMSDTYHNKGAKAFSAYILRTAALILAISAAAAAVGYFIGTEVLSLLYGISLTEYKLPLSVIILGGGAGAIVSFLYNVFTIIRRQGCIIPVSLITIAAGRLIVKAAVPQHGINGAAAAYVAGMLIMILLFCAFLLHYMHIERKQTNE